MEAAGEVKIIGGRVREGMYDILRGAVDGSGE